MEWHPELFGRTDALEWGEAQMRELVRVATLAPSGANAQPWRFVAAPGRIEVRLEHAESHSLLDYRQRATFFALGSATENLRLAAASLGVQARIAPFPDPGDRQLAAVVTFGRGPGEAGELPIQAVLDRVTNRRLAPPAPISSAQREAIFANAARAGAVAHLITDRDRLGELGRILGEGDRLRFVNDGLRREMKGEVLFREEDVRSGLGIDVRSLELGGPDLVGVRVALSGLGVKVLRTLRMGRVLEEAAHKSLEQCSGALLVTREGRGPRAFFEGGRAVERSWIAAQAAGLAVQPYAALIYLFLRLDDGGDAGGVLSSREMAHLRELRERFRGLFPLPSGHSDIMLLRLAHAGPPPVRALRRPIDQVFSFSGAPPGRGRPQPLSEDARLHH